MNRDEVTAAILAAVPRVTAVAEVSTDSNGAGKALRVKVRTADTAPMSGRELQDLVHAVWTSSDVEPNAIRITARDAATGDVPVDLRSAASDVYPDGRGYNDFGDLGVAIIATEDLLGSRP